MKRTVPLLITAIGGFVLIVAFFIPYTEKWGETAAIWFDILAAIAFILGGGNLMRIHLKKISDRQRGWGYSVITLLAFFTMLYFGLFKIGSKPTAKQEYYGEVFAPLSLDEFPEAFSTRIAGQLPQKGKDLPASVRGLISQDGNDIVFRTWMSGDQKNDLLKYDDTLEWRCTVETLFKQAQPKELKGKIAYYPDDRALAFSGHMTDAQRATLLKLPGQDNGAWIQAVEKLHAESNEKHSVPLESLPEGVKIPPDMKDVKFSPDDKTLSIIGPMSPAQKSKLAKAQFPLARPLEGEARRKFRSELESKGDPLNEEQVKVFDKTLDGTWSVDQLVKTLNAAGAVPEVDKTDCELLEEKQAGVKFLKKKKKVGVERKLTNEHVAEIRKFAADPSISLDGLVKNLQKVDAEHLADAVFNGPIDQLNERLDAWLSTTVAPRQIKALKSFFSSVPTEATRRAVLAVALLRDGPLTDDQRAFLTNQFEREQDWQAKVGELYVAAHTVRYPWSGEYRETGSPFWWMYEYAFKPLTATMFAMLAFYVASAAFRAFRAKNLEATLLLGTAFLILLGRTFAGVVLTGWIPENSAFAGLRIERLTVYIMTVFNTAGNRAIMIGIALGIAATSLKVLLGVDRSYLGSADE